MTTPESTTSSKNLGRKLGWALVGIVIVGLAVLSGRPSASSDQDGTEPGPESCTITVTADTLNVRAGPGTEYPTVDQLSQGTVVPAEPDTSGGFRKLAEGRWVAGEYANPSAGCG